MSEHSEMYYQSLFQDLERKLMSFEFSKKQIDRIYEIIAAIIHIENIDFVQDADDEDGFKISSQISLNEIDDMLHINQNKLKENLLFRSIRGEK